MIALFKKILWSLRYPWPRSAIEGRIRPLRISICPEDRFPELLALYEQNVPHGVPSGHREEYLSSLRGGTALTLVAEDDKQLVGTFGVFYGSVKNTYCLCYLMVSPDCHRRGVGTTMLLTSLALLPEEHPELTLCISAVPTATDFYSRFGFRQVGEHPHSSGQIHQLAVLPVTSVMSASCRAWLTEAGAALPNEPYDIPTERAAQAV